MDTNFKLSIIKALMICTKNIQTLLPFQSLTRDTTLCKNCTMTHLNLLKQQVHR